MKNPPRLFVPRPAVAERMGELLARSPNLSLAEVGNRLGLASSPVTVWGAMTRLGLTLQKVDPGTEGRNDFRRGAGGATKS